ncbi:MAG TPA: sugar ABC transporter ATP-binding protein [Opitutaceae bacterium]|nr:sugar ABC transporter ATP-binding protein [Opitutaceae bacterium]
MADNPLLTLRGIRKRFPGVLALDGVDFTVRAGEIHALLGENGAGKSTLIKVLTGVYTADEGDIRLADKPLQARSPAEAEEAGISTVYQEVNLIPSLSVAENLCLGRQPGKLGFIAWRALRRAAKASLARLGLDIDVDAELGSLSVALQQMVAIARALDRKARMLILDEPTASLDEKEVADLFRVMRQLRADGLGLIFVTHFLDQVYAVTDTITILRNGKLVGEYPTSSLSHLELVRKMLGREDYSEETGAHAAAKRALAEQPTVVEAAQLGRRNAVKEINLSIRAGETLGLAGLLGSGRTETARLLFGLDRRDSGEIHVRAKPAKLGSPRDAVRHGFAFCSEDRKAEGILPNLSVRENLILALQARRGAHRPLTRAEQEELCDRYVKALRIRLADTTVPIRTLSGGNQQKVLLARWLATQPCLLILDEPTRGIDIGARAEIGALVGKLCDEGMAVLLISSEIEEIVELSSRVIVLRERRFAGEFSGDEIVAPKLIHAMAAGGATS